MPLPRAPKRQKHREQIKSQLPSYHYLDDGSARLDGDRYHDPCDARIVQIGPTKFHNRRCIGLGWCIGLDFCADAISVLAPFWAPCLIGWGANLLS